MSSTVFGTFCVSPPLRPWRSAARWVTKQAGRRKQIRVTPRGHELMFVGGALFDDVRERWASRIGTHELKTLETHLDQLVRRRPLGVEDLARDAGS